MLGLRGFGLEYGCRLRSDFSSSGSGFSSGFIRGRGSRIVHRALT